MNRKIRSQQIKYRLVPNNDCNVFIDLDSTDLEGAALEALEILGYSILIKREPVVDESEQQWTSPT